MRFSITSIATLGLISLALAASNDAINTEDHEIVCADGTCGPASVPADADLAELAARSMDIEEEQEIEISVPDVSRRSVDGDASGFVVPEDETTTTTSTVARRSLDGDASGFVIPEDETTVARRSLDGDASDFTVSVDEAEEASSSTTTAVEKRQVLFAIEVAANMIPMAFMANAKVQNIIKQDIKRRQVFTQQTVGGMRRKFPSLNFVMSNVGYNFQGHVVAKKTVYYHNTIGRKVSFDVIGFRKGHFELRGDGGFQNWAFIGSSKCSHKGKDIYC